MYEKLPCARVLQVYCVHDVTADSGSEPKKKNCVGAIKKRRNRNMAVKRAVGKTRNAQIRSPVRPDHENIHEQGRTQVGGRGESYRAATPSPP